MGNKSDAANGLWGDADADEALQRYRTLLDTIDDGIYQLDAEGRFIAVNDIIVEMTGYSRDELLGAHVSLLLDDDDIERIEREIHRRITGEIEELPSFELAVTSADGEQTQIELQVNLLIDDDQLQGTVGVVRESTSEKQLDSPKPIRESCQPLISILDEAEVGVFLLDESFEIAWVDETAEQYFGLDREEVLGRDKRELIDETIRHRVADGDTFAETVLATYDDNSYVEQFTCRITSGDDRRERWLEHRSSTIESGQYAGGRIELYYDVTDRRENKQALKQSEQRFRSLVQAVDEYAIFMLDPDGCVVTWNTGAEQIKGYEPEEILGEHFSTFYTPEDVENGVPERNLERATLQGSIEDEGWRLRADGSTFWATVTITTIRDDEGTLQGYAKVTRDMTDQRKREQLLQREKLLERHQEYTDDILDAIDDVFYVLDDAGALRRWNESLCEMTGYSDAEVASMHALDFFDEDDKSTIEDAITKCFETGDVQVEADFFTKDGEQVPYEFVASTLEDPEENLVLAGIGRDVTERNKRERELEYRAQEQQVVADLGQFALETDDLDELMHKAVQQVAEVLDNEYCKVLDLDPEAEELLLRQGVGWREGIVGETTVSSVEAESQAAYTLANENPVVVENLETEPRLSGPDLLQSHNIKSGISTVIGSIDEPWGILGTHDAASKTFKDEDVNFVQSVANVLAEAIERHRYQEQLEQLIDDLEESNERLEQFAYAASHDLQEPLRMVSSYLQLIERRYADELDEDGQEFIDFAVDGADRMRDMIDALLEYSRVDTRGDPLQPVELNDVFADVQEDLQVKIEESDTQITTDSLPHVEGDPHQLRQLFQNLLDNAIEYSGDDPPQVHVSATRFGDEWKLSVNDEGVGIESEDQDRIFDVFQRLHTDDEHAGTGIGLALCRRIVERHGGEIWLDSEPGEGSTFWFTLPAAGKTDE